MRSWWITCNSWSGSPRGYWKDNSVSLQHPGNGATTLLLREGLPALPRASLARSEKLCEARETVSPKCAQSALQFPCWLVTNFEWGTKFELENMCAKTFLDSRKDLDAWTGVLIRWPINQSNRFSNFLRLDQLDRFGKITKSIFSKFFKKLQFFSDFQNFFGFLKFREKRFFLYII